MGTKKEKELKYDQLLGSILQEEQNIIGFLSSVFGFLARRTDFYYVQTSESENLGFPPGVAENLTVNILRRCNPNNQPANITEETVINDEIMCSTVGQEVEVISEEDIEEGYDTNICDSLNTMSIDNSSYQGKKAELQCNTINVPDSIQTIPLQKNSEAYNGAVTDEYSWSQTITELEVTIKLPPDIKTSKDLHLVITTNDLLVECKNTKTVLVKGTFSYPIKYTETYWTVNSGKMLINLEKQRERWWNALLKDEKPIDLSKIDCSRPMDELPEDHIAKIRELQWNQEQKMKGLPTTDDINKLKILEKAWNIDGSPFKGTPFDPSVLKS